MFNNIYQIALSGLLVFIFWMKTHGKQVEPLSPSMTNTIKGICAVGILMGHIDNPCFDFFHELSGPIVGCFFAMSGYGLARQYQIKGKAYIDSIPNKIIKLLLPYFVCVFLYVTLEHILIGKVTYCEILTQISQGHFSYILPFSWFVTAIIYFYVNFYIAFKCKHKESFLWLGFVVWYLYVNYILPGDNGFMWGTSASFALSVTYAFHQEKVNKYGIVLLFLIVLFCPLSCLQFTTASLLVLACLGGIHITNKLFKLLGQISYEVYIIQGVTLVLLVNNLYAVPNKLCWIVWLFVTLGFSYFFHNINKRYVYVSDKGVCLLKEDFREWVKHNNGKFNIITFFTYIWHYPEFRQVVGYRLKTTNILYKSIGWLMRKSSYCHNLYIVTPDIGEGFRPFHAFSTIVYAKSIGRNFCVFQNVTIGFNNGKNPTIGDNVTVFAGANVLGGVKIGDNVIIGAGSVVSKDIPSNTMVVGIPAKPIKKLNVNTNKWEKIENERL